MNLPVQSICLRSAAAFCLPVATFSIFWPLITTVAFGITLPSAGLITVAPTSAIFSACAVIAKIDNAIAARQLALLFMRMKPDLAFWFFWRHQFADRIEDDLKLRIVFLFQCGEFAGKIGIGKKHPTQAHECAHDRDVHVYSAFSEQDAGEHRHALLGEGIRQIAAPTAPAL